MSIEFDRATNQAAFNYRTNPPPFSEQAKVIQEAELVGIGKRMKDIHEAETRAFGCGCRNCHMDVSVVKEWYK